MDIKIFSKVVLFLVALLLLHLPQASEPTKRIGASERSYLEIVQGAVVVEDPADQIATSKSVIAFGKFKYSLDGSLPTARGQSSEVGPRMHVVKDSISKQIGLSNGQLIIKYKPGTDGLALAGDYRLTVVGELPSLDRIVVQLVELGALTQLQEDLISDARVLSTELDVRYGDVREQ